MLELAILGLLRNEDLHGYEIRRRLREELGVLTSVSFGSLYPALSRLERSGAVTVTEQLPPATRPRPPMTGSLGGERAMLRNRTGAGSRIRRARKVYRITEEGERLFEKLLEEEGGAGSDEGRYFDLKLAFARYLPPHSRIRLLERRRAQLATRLDQARSAMRPGAPLLDPYARTLVEHTADVTERELSWLDGLIAAEREGAEHHGRARARRHRESALSRESRSGGDASSAAPSGSTEPAVASTRRRTT
jgi:DNA-binding PadR family transcriptional regulator